MKLMLKATCLVLGGLLFSIKVQAQDFENLIKGSVGDANYLVEGYISPALKAFGTGFNQGWYNTAKPHKKFGFDLTVSVAGINVPSSDKFFTVDNAKLDELELKTDHSGNAVTGSGKVPTFFGPTSTQAGYDFTPPSTPFSAPGGLDLKEEIGIGFVPVPMYSIGFGLPKSIELKFRFVPTLKIDGNKGKVNFFGFGVLHDVKQYIPGIKMLPFDLSGFVGYTRLSINAELDDPSQTGEFVVSSTTIQGLISKKISVLTVYGGLGYDFTKSTLKAKGDYDLDDDASNGNEATDPLNINVSQSGPRATAGIRLKFAVFTLHGDYTLQKYSAFSVGFGINVR